MPTDHDDATTSLELAPGEVVDHYEIVRHIGSGGMATVYLARDTTLGRRVALKWIDGQRLPQGFSLEAFVAEARTLAQFSHPNIVTVFGVGRLGSRAYIAMEFVEGDPLRRRVESEGLSVREVQRIGLSIATGIAEAHAAQIVHGDLKPENVVIARDGRLRILDFGLAKLLASGIEAGSQRSAAAPTVSGPLAETQETVKLSEAEKRAPLADEDSFASIATGMKGTPAYMAPEQWRGETRTLSVDVWALGVILYELITGERPFNAPDLLELAMRVGGDDPAPSLRGRQDVPPPLADLVDRCLAKDPAKRPSAGECASALSRLVHGEAFTAVDAGASPFRGLDAFTEDHAAFFFGREEETDAFIERVRTDPVLPIVGASGVGKSSFIQAGVIPRLREKGEWRVVRMRPGAEPFRTLAMRLSRMGMSSRQVTARQNNESESPARIEQELFSNPKSLSVYLRTYAREQSSRVLLLVDQLEEVITLVSEPETRLRFLAAICSAADDPSDPVRVVFTVRDDFLTRLAESPDARAALSRVTVLRAPGDEALVQILERPLQAADYRYDDPTLVAEMIKAVANEASALPLLQFTGSLLWERRNERDKLLTRAAYDALGGVQGALATHADAFMRDLSEAQTQLVRTVMLRMVTPDGTRRVTPKRALIEALGEQADAVIARLTASRLIVARDVLDEPHLELSHESLVLTWDRLRSWLEQGREELVFLAELEQAAGLWEKRGRRRSEVWTGESFADAQRQLDRFRSRLPTLTQEFLAASTQAERRRRLVRRAAAATGVTALVVIAVVSVVTAASFAEKTAIARAQQAQAQAEGARSAYQRGDALAARAQLRSSLGLADSALVRSLWSSLQEDPVEWRKVLPAILYDVAVAPDGETLAVPSQDESVYLLDRATGASRTLRAHGDQVIGVAFSPDGGWLASGDMAGKLVLWRLADQSSRQLDGHAGIVWKLAFSPDSKRFVSAGWDGAVKVWDVDTGAQQLAIDTREGAVHRAVFSRDGARLFFGTGQGALRAVDAVSGEARGELRLERGAVTALELSGDGALLAVGTEGKHLALVDVATMALLREWPAHDLAVTDVAFGDGDTLLSTSYDGSIKRWRRSSGEALGSATVHSSAVAGIGALGSDKWVSVGVGDKSLVVWSADVFGLQQQAVGHDEPVSVLAFSPDGKTLYSAGDDKIARVWDTESGDERGVLRGAEDVIHALDVAPDGSLIAVASYDAKVRLYSAATRQLLLTLSGHDNAIVASFFNAASTELLSVSNDGGLRTWSVPSGAPLLSLKAPLSPQSAARGRDTVLLSTFDEGHVLFSWSKRRFYGGGKSAGFGVAVAPDDAFYAIARTDGVVDVFSPGSTLLHGKPVAPRGDLGRVHPDKRRLGFGFFDGARIWPLEDPSAAKKVTGHFGEVCDLAFSPDGARFATAGQDGTVRLWSTDTLAPVWTTRGVLHDSGLVLSHRGWRQLGDRPAAQTAAAPVASVELFARDKRWFEQDRAGGCALSEAGQLYAWTGAVPASLPVPGVAQATQVRRVPGGCLVAVGRRALLVSPAAQNYDVRELTADAHALGDVSGDVPSGDVSETAVGGSSLVVLADTEVLVFAAQSRAAERYHNGKRPSAAAADAAFVYIGFPDGGVEVVTRGSGARRSLSLEQQPAGPVRYLRPGPPGTLFIGYGSGATGLWSLRDGAQLKRGKMHGECVAMLRSGHVLHALSALGDALRFDLSSLEGSLCAVRNQVERGIGIVWRDGAPVRQAAHLTDCEP